MASVDETLVTPALTLNRRLQQPITNLRTGVETQALKSYYVDGKVLARSVRDSIKALPIHQVSASRIYTAIVLIASHHQAHQNLLHVKSDGGFLAASDATQSKVDRS